MTSDRLAALIAAALALATPALAEDAGGCGATYAVRSGDTLSAIAKRCGSTIEAMLSANPAITDPGRLSIGDELAVPGGDDAPGAAAAAPAPESAEPATGRYTIEPGDSMAGIAAELGLSLADLRAVNEGVDPRALQPGQQLILPEAAAGAEASGAEGHGTEAGSGRPAIASPEAGDADEDGVATAAEHALAGPEPAHEPERLALEGRIGKGAECPVLTAPDGRTYGLVSQSYGFIAGDHVAIEGETVEMSFCRQAHTVRVTSMTVKPAPQGGSPAAGVPGSDRRPAAGTDQATGAAVPIMQSRVTIEASRASSQSPVPAGRAGSTR